MRLNVFSIPPGLAFLRTFAAGLLARHPTEDDPFALADVRVFLPTRRAARAMTDTFLALLEERGGPGALLLPRLSALGDRDEDEFSFPSAPGEGPHDLAPALSPLRRRILLARLIRRMEAVIGEPTGWPKAIAYADSLGRLLDEAIIEGADLARLDEVVPETLAGHWQTSRRFIRLLIDVWPGVLEGEGAIDAADRQRRLMAREAEMVAGGTSAIYVAGSTGSVPQTAALMRAVAAHPLGAVVLPGLDASLDEEVWAAIAETHPQFALKRWLAGAGVDRRDVRPWTDEQPHAGITERVRLIAEALRPAPTTDRWRAAIERIDLEQATGGLKLHEADDEAAEARLIAVLMREALETPGRTAALVTINRRLARRVVGQLGRWSIAVDDSAGAPLALHPPAVFLDLIVGAAASDFSPVALAALLKHTLLLVPSALPAGTIEAFERGVLRGAPLGPGIGGLRLAHESRIARAEASGSGPGASLVAVRGLIDWIEASFRPLTDLAEKALVPQIAEAHAAVAGALCGSSLWRGPAGEAAATALEDIARDGDLGEPVSIGAYRELLEAVLRERTLRPRQASHPRLAIWGPLEARLQAADLVILGGLTEGTWPETTDTDGWASRTMRAAVGLAPPERRIGQQAHDFSTLAAAPQVVLTSARKAAGKPALPSRFILRLKTVLGAQAAPLPSAIALSPAYESLAASLDAPQTDYRPEERPAPCPPLAVRPQTLAVTDVERLRRDPYEIYAKHVLKLTPLDPIGRDADQRDLGTLVHAALEEFVRRWPDRLPPGAESELAEILRASLARIALPPERQIAWAAGADRIVSTMIAFERETREAYVNTAVEAPITAEWRTEHGALTLRGRIDRIDRNRQTGRLRIIDYKTGKIPTPKQVRAGFSPQLPLLGAMIARGGLEEVAGDPVEGLAYVAPSARGESKVLTELLDPVELIREADADFAETVALYSDPNTKYVSSPSRATSRASGDFDVLARVLEWRAAEEEEEEP